jgi:hypothetical protein
MVNMLAVVQMEAPDAEVLRYLRVCAKCSSACWQEKRQIPTSVEDTNSPYYRRWDGLAVLGGALGDALASGFKPPAKCIKCANRGLSPRLSDQRKRVLTNLHTELNKPLSKSAAYIHTFLKCKVRLNPNVSEA